MPNIELRLQLARQKAIAAQKFNAIAFSQLIKAFGHPHCHPETLLRSYNAIAQQQEKNHRAALYAIQYLEGQRN